MIIVMKRDASSKQIDDVKNTLRSNGCSIEIDYKIKKCIIAAKGRLSPEISVMPGIEAVANGDAQYILASKEYRGSPSTICVNSIELGSPKVVVIAGPCAVESYEQLLSTAKKVKELGATILRGGTFKARTSPYSFRGLGIEGLKMLAQARKETGLPVITEVTTPEQVESATEYVDLLQIGARNMQNFELLERVGKTNLPVLLKRGLMSSIDELLMSAEYIMCNGNEKVILCERGIRTFERQTRFTPDLVAIPLLKSKTHLPVMFDPSHSTGVRELIAPISAGAVACGADGIIVEVHPSPDKALCDGAQSLDFDMFANMLNNISKIVTAIGKTMS
jgi:3-deoxy-7-phosphoheptulonate synthase